MDDPEDPEKQSQIKQQALYYNWESFDNYSHWRKIHSSFWLRFYIVILGMAFFYPLIHFPYPIWTFISLFYLDFYFPSLFGLLFLFWTFISFFRLLFLFLTLFSFSHKSRSDLGFLPSFYFFSRQSPRGTV